jgi:formylglycine-generating enzyme required for sulfatase activity
MKTGSRWQIAALLVAVSASMWGARAHAQLCPGDLVPDGRVDGGDLGVLLAYWGPTNGSTFSLASDINQDGFVDGSDLGMLLGGWGTCSPVVTSVSPSTGVPIGGTSVTISGGYFGGVTAVRFGGAPAASFTITSSTQIRAITPPGALGAVDVEVSSPAGNSVLPSSFTYATVAVPAWATLVESFPDPTVVTDPGLRQRIADSGWAWRVRDTATQIEMLLVPPGSFQMGCSADQPEGCGLNEVPVRTVTLTSPFYLGRYEVTQAQWTARFGSNPSQFQGESDSPSRPVERVSWVMVQNFLTPAGFRLPTEAEWEFACRAGTVTRFHGFAGAPNGTADIALLGEIAWFNGNSGGQARPVGMRAGNGLGFHDMAGNVYEWVSDWYAHGYGSSAPAVNPTGPTTGTNRVLRSGSWSCDICCRSAFRNYALPTFAPSDFGFRVARNP